ncbi:cysteine motif protein 1 [Diadegma fenestrale ichnovirus]|nr:cysteine motif protein 1 [Diadegma fenestrale ichnovirus]
MKNIFLYAVLLGFTWASIMAEVSAEAECQAEREAVTDCIENYSNCSHSTKPCCRGKYLRDGSDVYEDFVCFHFGGSICQPLSNISNIVNYAQLVKNLNSTNFFERLRLFEENYEVGISDPEFNYAPFVVMGVVGALVIFLYAITIALFCYLRVC